MQAIWAKTNGNNDDEQVYDNHEEHYNNYEQTKEWFKTTEQ